MLTQDRGPGHERTAMLDYVASRRCSSCSPHTGGRTNASSPGGTTWSYSALVEGVRRRKKEVNGEIPQVAREREIDVGNVIEAA